MRQSLSISSASRQTAAYHFAFGLKPLALEVPAWQDLQDVLREALVELAGDILATAGRLNDQVPVTQELPKLARFAIDYEQSPFHAVRLVGHTLARNSGRHRSPPATDYILADSPPAAAHSGLRYQVLLVEFAENGRDISYLPADFETDELAVAEAWVDEYNSLENDNPLNSRAVVRVIDERDIAAAA